MDGSAPVEGLRASQQEAADQTWTIDLKLLSPSSEVPAGGLLLTSLPVTTTVAELRNLVTTSLPSHPSLARQRLIYLGRVLQRDNDTLSSVFGESAVRQSRQHTLHLVLRDDQVSNPASAANPNNHIPSATVRPSAAYQPPSGLRASSVPPRVSTSAGPTSWPSTLSNLSNPQQRSDPAQSLPHQSQLSSQTPSGQTRFQFGQMTSTGSVRVTANGQPVNLPPEVINQLLNQQMHRTGGLPAFIANAQAQQLAYQQAQQQVQQQAVHRAPTQGQTLDPEQPLTDLNVANVGFPQSAHQLQGARVAQAQNTNHFQQNLASATLNQTPDHGLTAPIAHGMGGRPGALDETEFRGRSVEPHSSTQSGVNPAVDRLVPTRESSMTGHTVREPSGVVPQGGQWAMRSLNGHVAQPQPGQMHVPFPLNQGVPVSLIPHQVGAHMPAPGTPLVAPLNGMRAPEATRQTGSPGSMSEGPRRVGTPAVELQQRLMHTNQEISNINQLLGVLAGGTTALGGPAPSLSVEQMAQMRILAERMSTHIDGFGTELYSLANTHPSVRLQPEYAGLNAMFRAVQTQGRALMARIEGLTIHDVDVAATASGDPPSIGSQAVPPIPDQTTATTDAAQTSPPSQYVPSNDSDTPPASLLGREASQNTMMPTMTRSAALDVHLLSDPTGAQNYLLLGLQGRVGVGQLPLDVLYPLLGAQLPHDQLLREFNRATHSMTLALQRQDLRASLSQGLNIPLSVQHATRAPSTRTELPTPPTNTRLNDPNPRQAENGQHVAPAPPAQAERPPAGPGDEMRDILAPLVRNIWLVVRLAMFAYFFLSSGRGYGRLIAMSIIGGLVWAINNGVFGTRVNSLWDGVRRHFEEVVEEARGQRQLEGQLLAPDTAGSTIAGPDRPTPEGTARRLVLQRAEGQRRRVLAVLRQVERTIALGLASLWPGVGEAVVRNHERRQREEEHARRRSEEEAKRRAEEEKARLDGNAGPGPATEAAMLTCGEGASASRRDVRADGDLTKVEKETGHPYTAT